MHGKQMEYFMTNKGRFMGIDLAIKVFSLKKSYSRNTNHHQGEGQYITLQKVSSHSKNQE